MGERLTILTVLGLWMCLSSTANGTKAFVYCSEASPSTFSPVSVSDGATFNATRPIYNGLVAFEYGETHVIPALAETWTISPGGKVYTFHLRKGVQFHSTPYFTPTRNFNADDVLFSFNRQRLSSHPYHRVGGGRYEYFQSMGMTELIQDVQRVDDYTVRFILERSESPFLADLAMDFAGIHSAEYAEKLLRAKTPDKLDLEPIGTGPFIFSRYVKDQFIKYNTNTQYFRGRAPIDKLIFSITTDPSVRHQKLKTGECHLAAEPSPTDLPSMLHDPKLKVMEKPGLNIGYLAFNVEKPPLNNLLVRKAIHYALNRNSYIHSIYLGRAIVAKNPIPPTLWGYDDTLADYAYDPEKAKALLTEAGFPKGFPLELWTLPVSRPYNPNGRKMGELIQADLSKIGIQVSLMSYDWPTYLAKSKNGEHQVLQFGWTSDNGDPDNFLHTLLGCSSVPAGSNRARWCFEPFDQLVLQAKLVSDRNQRISLYQKAQKIFKEQVPWVTLAHSTVYRAMSKNVVGYKIDPFGGDYFQEVDLLPEKL